MNIGRDKYINLETLSAFAVDAIHGLSLTPKSLLCKWFYDENGSRLFEEITKTPEYYLTRVETMLLLDLVSELTEFIPHMAVVIEPGSGSSIKTRILLESQPKLQRYIPIDISEEFLLEATRQLKRDFPALEIAPLVADFTGPMPELALDADAERMVFFPGSTIGNFTPEEAKQLLRHIHTMAGKHAWLLIGVDMTQDEDILLAAYNDAAGLTAQFNKNILVRANRELDADFDLTYFSHRAYFNKRERRVEMHLVSEKNQQVKINDQAFYFKQGESIHTENCYKYSRADFELFAHECGWRFEHVWTDQQESNFGIFLLKSI